MKRGRKSANEIATVTTLESNRPLPMEGLTEAQSDVWITTVGRLPTGWFPAETWEVLAAYCRHVVSAQFLSDEINRWNADWFKEDGGLERFDRLLKMRDRETRAIVSCARSLRITNQSRQDPKTAGRASRNSFSGEVKPWEPTGQ